MLTVSTALGYFHVHPGGALRDSQTLRPIGPLLPDWGSVVTDPPLITVLTGQWWKFTPFLALWLAVLAFHLLGEGLRRRMANKTGWHWSR